MTICQALKALGLNLRSAWPLSFCLSSAPAALVADELTLNLPQGGFISLGIDERLGAWLEHLSGDGLKPPLPCIRLDQQSAVENGMPQHASSGAQLQIIQSPSPLSIPVGAGFLYGEFAPPRAPSAMRRDLRVALRLALGFTFAAVLLAALQWGWLVWQAGQYRQAITNSFRTVSPQGAMVDPLLQMQRQVDALRHASGQLASGDFLRLLTPLAGLSEKRLNVQTLSYDKGHLRISGQLTNEDLQTLAQDCRRLGLNCKAASHDKPTGGNLIDLEISEGGK